MGAIRLAPSLEVHSQAQNFPQLNYVEASICGWQHHMEDYTAYAQINPQLAAFFVVDGHGGPDLAQLAIENIPQILKQSQAIKQQQYKLALQLLFEELDIQLKGQAKRASSLRQKVGLPPLTGGIPTSGCSVAIALVGQNQITIANIGECKCYVCYCSNPSKAVLISGNHSQTNTEDQNRVKNAGGFFINGRLNSLLPFTRSIGDYSFKDNQALHPQQQLLTPTPSIFSLRKEDIRTVVIGSGGLWENPTHILREITEEDLELAGLKQKTQRLLQDLVCKNPQEGEEGLQNMAILVIDLKY